MAVKEQKWNGKALRIGELEAEVPIIQGGMGVGISRSGRSGRGCDHQRSGAADESARAGQRDLQDEDRTDCFFKTCNAADP